MNGRKLPKKTYVIIKCEINVRNEMKMKTFINILWKKSPSKNFILWRYFSSSLTLFIKFFLKFIFACCGI